MNNKTLIICLIIILLLSYKLINNKIKQSTINQETENFKNTTREIKSINEIKDPDEIIYYKNENKIVIKKEDDKYLKIIKLNKARDIGDLELFELVVENLEDNKPNSFLEYKYSDESSIYFSLEISQHNLGIVWIPYNTNEFKSGAYGNIKNSEELINYLDIKE